VVFAEDAALFKDFNAATNSSLIRDIVINVARHNDYDSLTKAERFLSHDVSKLFSLLTTNYSWVTRGKCQIWVLIIETMPQTSTGDNIITFNSSNGSKKRIFCSCPSPSIYNWVYNWAGQ
jgi:hypothetical protein